MKWQNLKANKCPKCNKDLASRFSITTRMFECPCGFKITAEKFTRLTQTMVSEDLEKLNDAGEEIQDL